MWCCGRALTSVWEGCWVLSLQHDTRPPSALPPCPRRNSLGSGAHPATPTGPGQGLHNGQGWTCLSLCPVTPPLHMRCVFTRRMVALMVMMNTSHPPARLPPAHSRSLVTPTLPPAPSASTPRFLDYRDLFLRAQAHNPTPHLHPHHHPTCIWYALTGSKLVHTR